MTNDRTSGQRGFTLLEILVAMTLLGIVMVLLFGGLRLGTRAWERGDERSEELARLEVVQGFIRRHLSQAYPLVVSDSRGERRISFVGRPDTLEFTTLMPAHLGAGGFHRLVLSVAADGAGKRLVLRRRLFQPGVEDSPGRPGAEDEHESVLLERISGAAFSYYGATEANEEPEWRDAWEGAQSPPLLVRLDVTFPKGDRRYWPELVVRPRIGSLAATAARAAPRPGTSP